MCADMTLFLANCIWTDPHSTPFAALLAILILEAFSWLPWDQLPRHGSRAGRSHSGFDRRIHLQVFIVLHQFGRALCPKWAKDENVPIDHGGFGVFVAHQLLHCANVLARFQQVDSAAGLHVPLGTAGSRQAGWSPEVRNIRRGSLQPRGLRGVAARPPLTPFTPPAPGSRCALGPRLPGCRRRSAPPHCWSPPSRRSA